MNRLLRLPLPESYVPTRTEALRDRLRSRPAAPAAKAARKPDRKAATTKKRKPPPADRQVRRSGHHGGRTGTGRRARAMEGQRYG
jgi:cell division protein FtsW